MFNKNRKQSTLNNNTVKPGYPNLDKTGKLLGKN